MRCWSTIFDLLPSYLKIKTGNHNDHPYDPFGDGESRHFHKP
jgi:hypothetical protein